MTQQAILLTEQRSAWLDTLKAARAKWRPGSCCREAIDAIARDILHDQVEDLFQSWDAEDDLDAWHWPTKSGACPNFKVGVGPLCARCGREPREHTAVVSEACVCGDESCERTFSHNIAALRGLVAVSDNVLEGHLAIGGCRFWAFLVKGDAVRGFRETPVSHRLALINGIQARKLFAKVEGPSE